MGEPLRLPDTVPSSVRSSIGVALLWAMYDDEVRSYMLDRIEARTNLPDEGSNDGSITTSQETT